MIEESGIKVSVIVPIYNVEKFISRCAASLLKQTLQEVEFIFVDDATPDSSIRALQETIEDYPQRKGQVKLIRHENNEGLPTARNSGLVVAKGEYVFHCDGDDFVEPDMLEQLYRTAKGKSADIVWCDWWLSFGQNERYMQQPSYATAIEALKGILSGVMKYNVWNKLVRRQLYVKHSISFPSGYGMGEDMTMIRLFARAKTVAYQANAYYHYVQLNTAAFSRTYSDSHLKELQHNVSIVIDDLKTIFGTSLDKEIAFFKLEVKFPFLFMEDKSKQMLWQSWYPEASEYIWQNRQMSLHRRCLQWLARKKQFWAIRIYYKYVHRIIYGFIYR